MGPSTSSPRYCPASPSASTGAAARARRAGGTGCSSSPAVARAARPTRVARSEPRLGRRGRLRPLERLDEPAHAGRRVGLERELGAADGERDLLAEEEALDLDRVDVLDGHPAQERPCW